MKRRFLPLLALCPAMLLLASCLGDNNQELISYDDAAITSFSVKNLKRVVHTKSSQGTDSTYTTTFAADGYKFYIDQIKKEIYNPDSLPVGVDASKVVSTITAKNAGTLAIKSVGSDTIKYYNTTDSIDFTQPRQIVVYNHAGTGANTYTIRVNVHREEASEFKWRNTVGANADLGALTEMRVLALGDGLYVFGNREAEAKIYAASRNSGANWQEIVPNTSLTTAFYRNVVAQGQTLYAYDGGKVMTSADAKTWSVVATVELGQLMGASDKKLYALAPDGKIMFSANQGLTWEADEMEASATLLSYGDLNFVVQPQKTNKGVHRLLVAGTAESNASLWGKIEENDSWAENQPWTYYTPSAENVYLLPNLTNLQMVRYGEALVAMGGAGKGSSSGVAAFSQMYDSKDGGLTWKKHGTLAFPAGFSSSHTSFAMTADADHYLWIVCGQTGQVWKGRLNELGWKTEKKEFTE